jgi:energy-coupling factor transporter ATP-binding protein EcfA2
LCVLRDRLRELDFPFDSASSAAARRDIDDALALLDRYVLPRLGQFDAPLLVAAAGSTGVGKSTLINAVAGDVVTAPGVLRPTTRIPQLIHHPGDTGWFGSGNGHGWLGGDHVLVERLSAEGVPAGVALLDTPPLGSVVDEIRLAAVDSLLAADLWLFMTTAARYADALPWELLSGAAQRRSSVAVVLNRVPQGSVKELRAHLAGLLAQRGLGDAPLFALEETALGSSGILPAEQAEPVRRWVHGLAGDEHARTAVIGRTVHGAVTDVLRRVETLAGEAGVDVLDDAARTALTGAVADARRALEDVE